MSEMEWRTVKREKMQRLLSPVIRSLTHVPSRRGKPSIFCGETDHPFLAECWRKSVSCASMRELRGLQRVIKGIRNSRAVCQTTGPR